MPNLPAGWTDEPETVPLWPHAGTKLGLGRAATYAAAARKEIPTIEAGRNKRVSVRVIERMLEGEAA
jgi:hypothetical protein